MKKKILKLFTIIMMISLFFASGCNNNQEKIERNSSFGKYTGIYKLKNYELKVFHNGDDISLFILKDGDFHGNNSSIVEDNKVIFDEYEFEFADDIIKVKSDSENIPSGEYKLSGTYTTDEIYKDYIGDVSLIDSKYNYSYENDGLNIYTIQESNTDIRIKYETSEESVNINLSYVEDDHFSIDFFDDIYDVKYENDSLILNVTSTEENKVKVNGTYSKKSKLTKEEIIKIFHD